MTTAQCPSCFTWTDQAGETVVDDRGPFQRISTRRYVCPECGGAGRSRRTADEPTPAGRRRQCLAGRAAHLGRHGPGCSCAERLRSQATLFEQPASDLS